VIQSLCEAVQKLKIVFHLILSHIKPTIYNSHNIITFEDTCVWLWNTFSSSYKGKL